MSEHPIVGERILARTKDLAGVAPIVRHEHEHWDGTGYPDGLERQRIPIGSRVDPRLPRLRGDDDRAAVPRRARRRRASSTELRAGAGTKFDPEVIDALLDLLGHNTPEVPEPRRGREARRADRRASLSPGGRRAGLGTGRVTSVAE